MPIGSYGLLRKYICLPPALEWSVPAPCVYTRS
jgi:hypothetical protein